jgi:hypothetical protein
MADIRLQFHFSDISGTPEVKETAGQWLTWPSEHTDRVRNRAIALEKTQVMSSGL